MMESNDQTNLKNTALYLLAGIVLGVAALMVMLIVAPVLTGTGQTVASILSLDNEQGLWYITRSAGLVAYLLLWLSMVWGLAVSSKLLDPLLHRASTYDFHQFISLLAIVFTVIHIVVLLPDRYLPFTVAQLLVPFISPYRPLWTGLGIIGLYLTLLVTITFYLRRQIGQKAFRSIHLASFAAYAGVTLHGLFAGTDSALGSTVFIYAGTALILIFMTAYWYLTVRLKPRREPVPRRAPVAQR